MANLSTITNTYFFNLLLNAFIILSTLIHSYPLYILYLCYFTPYILKILSFLYPLFITTSLLLISLVTAISPDLVKDILQLKTEDGDGDGDENEDCHSLEALEIYKMVFNTSMLDELGTHVEVSDEYPEEKILETVESSLLKISKNDEQDCFVKTEEALKVDTILEQDSSTDNAQFQSIKSVIRKFEGFLKEPEDSEFTPCNEEIKKVQTEINQAFDKQHKEHYGNSRRDSQSRTNINNTENNNEFTSKDEIYRQPRSDLGRYGSMRKEREWRSTLACKLFEEKHNSPNIDDIEGMDLLWEKYDEGESTNRNTKKETKNIDSSKFKNNKYEYVEDEDEDEDDEDDVGVHLCCLQAFKLSTTKMNLGVGRRNLAKISKAVKGLGWMHKASKHSKKVHNNNGETLQFS